MKTITVIKSALIKLILLGLMFPTAFAETNQMEKRMNQSMATATSFNVLNNIINKISLLPEKPTGLAGMSSIFGNIELFEYNTNEHYRRWKSKVIKIDPYDFTVFARQNSKNNLLASMYVELQTDVCITREMLHMHYADLKMGIAANNPSPDAQTTYIATINGKIISFGFPNKNPDCLARIIRDF